MKTIKYKGFTIEAETGTDPQIDVTISKTINGKLYSGSIGCAESEGLCNEDWTHHIQVPVNVLEKAYDLEESLLSYLSLAEQVSL
jgi:hypothetical protein